MSYAVYMEKISETMNPILPNNIWKSMYPDYKKYTILPRKNFFINEEKEVR